MRGKAESASAFDVYCTGVRKSGTMPSSAIRRFRNVHCGFMTCDDSGMLVQINIT